MNEVLSWWDKLKSYFSGFPEPLVDFGLAALLGAVFGFLMKNFGRYLFFSLLILAIALYGLNYFEFVTIHTEQVQEFFGIQEIPPFNELFNNALAWMQTHVAIWLGALFGFLVGWKLGN